MAHNVHRFGPGDICYVWGALLCQAGRGIHDLLDRLRRSARGKSVPVVPEPNDATLMMARVPFF